MLATSCTHNINPPSQHNHARRPRARQPHDSTAPHPCRPPAGAPWPSWICLHKSFPSTPSGQTPQGSPSTRPRPSHTACCRRPGRCSWSGCAERPWQSHKKRGESVSQRWVRVYFIRSYQSRWVTAGGGRFLWKCRHPHTHSHALTWMPRAAVVAKSDSSIACLPGLYMHATIWVPSITGTPVSCRRTHSWNWKWNTHTAAHTHTVGQGWRQRRMPALTCSGPRAQERCTPAVSPPLPSASPSPSSPVPHTLSPLSCSLTHPPRSLVLSAASFAFPLYVYTRTHIPPPRCACLGPDGSVSTAASHCCLPCT